MILAGLIRAHWGMARVRGVRMDPLGRPVSVGTRIAQQTTQPSSAIHPRKRDNNRALRENQLSILSWPDSRALIREAGSDGGDYGLSVVGVEPLDPRSNYLTSTYNK